MNWPIGGKGADNNTPRRGIPHPSIRGPMWSAVSSPAGSTWAK